MFKFKYEKANKGEHFEGLDLITKLLTPHDQSKTNKTRPLIEELEELDADNENEVEEGEDEDEISWFIDQKENQDEINEIKLNQTDICYGFAQTKSNIFAKLSVRNHLIKLSKKKIDLNFIKN